MKLTAKQLEALAAGATYEEMLAMETSEDEVAAVADAILEEQAAALVEGEEVEAPGAEAQAGDEVDEDAVDEGAVDLKALQAQLAELQASNKALEDKLVAKELEFKEALEAKEKDLAAKAETSEKFAAVLRPYVDRMATALNQAVDATSAEQVLEAHNRLQPSFAKAFKAGRQSVSPASATSSEKLNKQDADMLLRAKSFTL